MSWDALAAVAAAGSVFAQASITGTVGAGWQKLSSGTAGDTSTAAGIGAANKGAAGLQTADIRFNVSEDLGGGLRASAFVQIDGSNGRGGEVIRDDAGMSLAGGFGTVAFSNTRSSNLATGGGVYAASMPTTSWDRAGLISVAARSQVNVIQYTSPEVMPGLRISVAQAHVMGTNLVRGAATSTSNTAAAAGKCADSWYSAAH